MPTYKIQVLNNFKPDWNQTDETQADYIKNKPTLGTLAEKDSEIYIGSGEMPEGYIMQIDPNGTSPSILPDVTEADNGKVLRVVAGVWAAASIPNAEGVGF